MDAVISFLETLERFALEPEVYSIVDGVRFGLRPSPSGDAVCLEQLHTDIGHRGAGLASETLHELCRHADDHQVALCLEVDADDGLDTPTQLDWYRRNGFIGDATAMVRKPAS